MFVDAVWDFLCWTKKSNFWQWGRYSKYELSSLNNFLAVNPANRPVPDRFLDSFVVGKRWIGSVLNPQVKPFSRGSGIGQPSLVKCFALSQGSKWKQHSFREVVFFFFQSPRSERFGEPVSRERCDHLEGNAKQEHIVHLTNLPWIGEIRFACWKPWWNHSSLPLSTGTSSETRVSERC